MKKQRGITLIALVITIIVLLILSGVSIATLTGNNGLLQKSAEAKNKTIEGKETEEIALSYNAVISRGKTSVTAEELQAELDILVGNGETFVTEENDMLNVYFTNTSNSYNVSYGVVNKDTNSGSIRWGKVIDNRLYLLLKNGNLVSSEGKTIPEDSEYVEYEKENEALIRSNVKECYKTPASNLESNYYLTNDNTLYDLTNKKIGENVSKYAFIFNDGINGDKMGYITTNNELYRASDNTKIKDNVKEVFMEDYYLTTDNKLYKFSNNQKVADDVKKTFHYESFTANGSGTRYGYITNNNEFYLFGDTNQTAGSVSKIADNVYEVLQHGRYLTLDNSFYNNDGTKIDDNVSKICDSNIYVESSRSFKTFYLTVNDELFEYDGNEKVKIADGVKKIFENQSFEDNWIIGIYYIRNDDKIFDIRSNEVSKEEIEREKFTFSRFFEDTNGKIYYYYSIRRINNLIKKLFTTKLIIKV